VTDHVHVNFYGRRAGDPVASPLANRGPEALQRLLVEDGPAAETSLRLLTRTELVSLAASADLLAHMARLLIDETWPDHD